MIPRRAMILAAGLGTRMRPLTDSIPKPMVEVAGKPLIDYAIDFFMQRGVSELVINASYKADILLAHVATRRDVNIVTSYEPEPLETGGGIAQALPHFKGEPFFCLNSDNIVIDPVGDVLEKLAAAVSDSTDAVLLLHPAHKATGYDGAGDFFLTPDHRLKRRGDAKGAPYVFAGLQWLHPQFFSSAPAGKFSMNLLYNKGMETNGTLARSMQAVVHGGDWLHVGDPAALALANQCFS